MPRGDSRVDLPSTDADVLQHPVVERVEVMLCSLPLAPANVSVQKLDHERSDPTGLLVLMTRERRCSLHAAHEVFSIAFDLHDSTMDEAS